MTTNLTEVLRRLLQTEEKKKSTHEAAGKNKPHYNNKYQKKTSNITKSAWCE